MSSSSEIGIIGGGAWGTALAIVAARNGHNVLLWARETETVAAINNHRENKIFLPGIALDPRIRATGRFADLASCGIILLVAPAQHTRAVCRQLASALGSRKALIIVCAKGIEQETLTLPGEIVASELRDHPLAVLSGPSFAAEVARGLPTALTFATRNSSQCEPALHALSGKSFRLYLSDDVTGAQIGGAVKNVLAVACGVVAGRNMGDNARAALITRGLAEMTRLGVALGGRAETLMGLSGLGDLALTCSSMQSRNMSLGAELGQGKKLADILGARAGVTEGVATAAAALALAKKHNVEMPITEAVDAILNKGAVIESTIDSLLGRPLKTER